jgi:hypothetical protein
MTVRALAVCATCLPSPSSLCALAQKGDTMKAKTKVRAGFVTAESTP